MAKRKTQRRRGRGRPAWKPTRKEREQVRTMAAMGFVGTEIARVMGVTVKTLRKYCRDDLETAAPKAVAAVALSLYKQATHPDKPNVVAGIFFLKAKGGWRDNDRAGTLADAAEGKKAQRNEAARKIAASGRFKPGAAPRLATVNGVPADKPTQPEPPK